MSKDFSFEQIVSDLKTDAEKIGKVLSHASEFGNSADLNRYPAAIKSLKETMSLIRDYDWKLKYSQYTTGTDAHREVAIWEQNGQGEIRNHKRFSGELIEKLTGLFKAKHFGDGETVCGCLKLKGYSDMGDMIYPRDGLNGKYSIDINTLEPCTVAEEQAWIDSKTK